MKRDTSIIVLCHNKAALTRKCIESLHAHAGSAEVLVFDNASTDETPGLVADWQRRMPNLTYLRSERNLGFGAGNNQAAQTAVGENLVFLNNDTEVQAGWLAPLVERMCADADVGAVGSMLVYPDGRLQEAGAIVFRDGSAWNVGKFDDPDDPRYNLARQVDYCSGAALAVRASVFRQLNGFDPLFDPAYYEDADLCFRLRQAGYSVWYEPRSRVVHHEGGTAGTDVARGFKRYQDINRQKFIRRWASELAHQPEPPSAGFDPWTVADRRRRGEARPAGRLAHAGAGALPNGGVTYGGGVYEDEAGWRWLAPVADLFVWSEAIAEPSTLSFTLHCSAPDHYARTPFESRIAFGHSEHVEVVFDRGLPVNQVRLPLLPGAGDARVHIATSQWFVPAKVGLSSDSRELAVRIGNVHVTRGLPAS